MRAARALLEQGEALDTLIVDIEPQALDGFEVVKAYHRLPGPERPALAISAVFRREHIEGMLENVGVRRLLSIDVPREELLFWLNHALYPEAMRSRKAPRIPASFVLSIAERKRVLRGRAHNLSEDGLFLETALAAEPGEVLELRFRLPGNTARREGIAVKCQVGLGESQAPRDNPRPRALWTRPALHRPRSAQPVGNRSTC